MKTYDSPVYPALMVKLPSGSLKAMGGVFHVPADQVDEFEAFVAERPHYQIRYTGTTEDAEPEPIGPDIATSDTITQPEPMSAGEKHPELAAFDPDALGDKTNAELNDMLETRGLPTGGTKAELIARLTE